jgi:uncharacterized iron-regulated membrane protein
MRLSDPLPAQTALYRAVWRWHFVAGLFALPLLLNLAITGGFYLFTPEINHILYRSFEDVPARAGVRLSAKVLVQKAEASTQGDVLRLTQRSEPDKSVEMLIRTGAGENRTAYVDPYDGSLLGTIPVGGVMQIVRKIHSLQYFGFWASCLVEIAAGWTIVLALSGIFLWWPRGRSGGVVTIRTTPKYRTFWRDLHAVTGLFASSIIVFLAVTGMPWSMVWGNYVQEWTTAAGLGQPKPPVEVVPSWKLASSKSKRHVHGGETPAANLPWALKKVAPPESMPAAQPSITLDQALVAFAAIGLEQPFDVALPQGPEGAFTATTHPARVEKTRTVYLDQYTGKVLGDVDFSQYGPAAKAIEWGIAVHQGEEYGSINRYVMLSGCIAVVVLAVSAPVMWWTRRPKGSFGMPPQAANRRAALGVLAVMAIAGLIYPLVGLSMLAALIVERAYERTRRTFRRRARVLQ